MNNVLSSKSRTLKSSPIVFILIVCLTVKLSIFVLMHFLGYSPFVISGSSMEPEYPAYSLVIIKKTSFDDLKIGDVIIFKSVALNNNLAFHRIIRISEQGVYTKGDNNNKEDNQLITKESYVGKEAFRITFLASYISRLQNPSGFTIYFLMPLLAGILVYISFKMLGNIETKT